MHVFPLLAAFVGGEIVDMLSTSGPVAKLVLLVLLAFSLISWAIILTKWSLLRRAKAQSGRFVRAFRKAQRLQDIVAVADQFKPSPLVGVFEGGYEEYRHQVASSGGLRSMVPIQRGMQIGSSEEITRLERNCRGWRSLLRRLPLSDCSVRCGASLMHFMGSEPPGRRLCVQWLRVFPRP